MRQRGMQACYIWQDKRVVRVLSTNTKPTSTGTVKRKLNDGTHIHVPCPAAVMTYNTYMRGVDRGDQLTGYYKSRSKGRKFYKYIFWFLLDVAITNSYTLSVYRLPESRSRVKTIKQFRVDLAQQLIGDYNNRKRPGSAIQTAPRPLPLSHFPIRIAEEGKYKRGRCHRCLLSEKRSDTTWRCSECNKWLCHNGVTDACYQKNAPTPHGAAASATSGCVTMVTQRRTASTNGTCRETCSETIVISAETQKHKQELYCYLIYYARRMGVPGWGFRPRAPQVNTR